MRTENEAETDLLFAYGTLRRGCDGAEARAFHDAADWLGQARTAGCLYRVDWYPAFVPGGEGQEVTGDLFRLREPASALAWIDRYEECSTEFPEPREYRRMIVDVRTKSGTARAWAYVYNRAIDGLEAVAGGDWMDPQAVTPRY